MPHLIVVAALFILAAGWGFAAELQAGDFWFRGPLGSDGASIRKLGPNHFELLLGHAPKHPDWANNVQFEIRQNAKGNPLRLEVAFNHPKPTMLFDEYPPSWSHDGENWCRIPWKKGGTPGIRRTLEFPVFTGDRVVVGNQVPMSYEQAERLIANWRRHPHFTATVIGNSLEGRNLYRLTVTDSDSPYPPGRRWVHHIANQHAGEGVAVWRIAGMIDWLLSDAAAGHRRRTICHFTLQMSPDSPSHGWYRVNADGIDMNRSYRVAGADPARQPHEAYVFQHDLEQLMRSEAPLITSWSMHGWPGPMDPYLVGVGPEFGTAVGPWPELAARLASYDTSRPRLSNPLRQWPVRDPKKWSPYCWDDGVFLQFGITNALVEGGGDCHSKEQSRNVGAALMRAM